MPSHFSSSTGTQDRKVSASVAKELLVNVWIPGMFFKGSGWLSGESSMRLTLGCVTVGEAKETMQDELIPELRERVKNLHRETLINYGSIRLFHTSLGRQGLPERPLRFTELGPDNSLLWEDHGPNLPLHDRIAKPVVHCYVDLQVKIQLIADPFSAVGPPAVDPTLFTNSVLKLTVVENYWETSHMDDIKELIQRKTGWHSLGLHIMWEGKELVRVQKKLHVTNRINRESIFSPNSIQHGSTLQIWVQECIVHVLTLQHVSILVPLHYNDSVRTLQEKVVADDAWNEGDGLPMLVLSDGTAITGAASSTISDVGISNGSIVYAAPVGCNRLQNSDLGGGCNISKAELRGITLMQLRELATAVLLRCKPEGWKSTNSKHRHKALEPPTVTLYDLMEHFIIPITRHRQCSYVELVSAAETSQKPRFFCSHWWGEPILDFLACVERHAHDRDLPDTVTYWVCAYARNQHALSGELRSNSGSSHRDTPFYKAIQGTEGTVVVLDSGSVVYNRIWCVFEMAIVFTDRKERGHHSYDIYTIPPESDDTGRSTILRSKSIPVGLTDGPVGSDLVGISAQIQRQSLFPLQVCDASFSIRLEMAKASHEEDKQFILNTIIGNQQSATAAPDNHPAYEHLNATLKGKFAQSTYRKALEDQVQNIFDFRQALSAAPLLHLEMDFSKCEKLCSSSELEEFARSLPTSLEALNLNLSRIRSLRSLDGFSPGLGRLVRLQSLVLDLSYCYSIQEYELLWLEIGKLSNLRQLQLVMAQCGYPHVLSWKTEGCSVATLGKSLNSLVHLSTLSLDFHDFHIGHVGQLGMAIGCLQSLSSLSLSFSLQGTFGVNCDNAFGEFMVGLSHAMNLRDLFIHVWQNFKDASFELFAGAFLQMPAMEVLQSLELKFTLHKVESIGTMAVALCRARELVVLRLKLSGYYGPASLDELGNAFASMPLLQELEVSARHCRPLKSIEAFSRGLLSLTKLESLSLDFHDTKVSSIDSVKRAAWQLKNLGRFEAFLADGTRLTSKELGTGQRFG